MTNNKMKLFTATKQIESITIHYNERLDGGFVRQLEEYIVRVAKKLSGVNLKAPKEVNKVNVFIHPDPSLFNRMFNSRIEKQCRNRGMRIEEGDLYIVRDDDGNIHMASPRGKSATKVDTLSKLLVVKILGEYMEENQKQKIQTVTREVYKEKEIKIKKEQEQKEKEEREKKEAEEKEREEEEEKQRLEEEEKERERQEEEARLEAELEEERLRQEEEEAEKERIEQEERERQEQEELDNLIATQQDIEEIVTEEEKELPLWIVFGWQGYAKGKLNTKSKIEKFSKYMNRKGYIKPKNVTEESEQEYAIAQVEYIIETYGFKKFKEILLDPDSMYKKLHVKKHEFEKAVKAYTMQKYGLKPEPEFKLEDARVCDINDMIIEADKVSLEENNMEKPKFGHITEVTIIREASDGSYILPEDNEIKKIKE